MVTISFNNRTIPVNNKTCISTDDSSLAPPEMITALPSQLSVAGMCTHFSHDHTRNVNVCILWFFQIMPNDHDAAH